MQAMGPSRQLVSAMGRDEPVAFKVTTNRQAGLLSKSSKVFRGGNSERWIAPKEVPSVGAVLTEV